MSFGNRRSYLVAAVGCFWFAAMSSAQTSVDLNDLDAYIEKARSDWEVPGLAVAIVKDGEVELHELQLLYRQPAPRQDLLRSG